jgi:hypothetical protein
LYEEKGNRKFLLQSLVEIESEREETDKEKKKKYLTALIEIDPIRINYYKFLLSI